MLRHQLFTVNQTITMVIKT